MTEPQTCSPETASPSRSKLQSIWAWLKRWLATSTPKTHAGNDPLIMALELLKAQHATLDRVVQAKFDVPMRATTPQAPSEPMFPKYMLGDVLSTESDAEFLQKTESLSN